MRFTVDMLMTDFEVFQKPDHQSLFRLFVLVPGVIADEDAARAFAHYGSENNAWSF